MEPKKIGLALGMAALVVLAVVGAVALSRRETQRSATKVDSPLSQTQTKGSTEPKQTDQPSKVDTGPRTVLIQNFNFQPATISIKKGTTVTWTNQDSAAHTVTSDKSSAAILNSPSLAQGEEFSFTFNDVGTFTYYCEPHPNMRGSIVVAP
jgi:plastocyanin